MKVQKVQINMDLTILSLASAVQQYVQEFGHWPHAVIAAASNSEAFGHAKELGLSWHALPQDIAINYDAWAVVGRSGETIWSPGA